MSVESEGIADRVATPTRISAEQRIDRPPFPKKAKVEVTPRLTDT
jgi:hypothetical protein